MFTTISTRNGRFTAAVMAAAFSNAPLKGESVRQHRGTPRRKRGSNWARLLVIGLGAVTSAAAGLVVLPGGTIAVNSTCGTSFGTCSFGIPDPADNGLQTGALAWFQDHFGAFARVSANSTDRTGSDNAG